MTFAPLIDKDGLIPEQQALWDEVTTGPCGFAAGRAEAKNLSALYNCWLLFPPLGLLMKKPGDEIRRKNEIRGKLREMVVITTSALLDSPLELKDHSAFAKVAGLSEKVIQAIQEGTEPPFEDSAERAVYDANVELVKTGTLSDVTRDAVVDMLGRESLMQLIGLIGDVYDRQLHDRRKPRGASGRLVDRWRHSAVPHQREGLSSRVASGEQLVTHDAVQRAEADPRIGGGLRTPTRSGLGGPRADAER